MKRIYQVVIKKGCEEERRFFSLFLFVAHPKCTYEIVMNALKKKHSCQDIFKDGKDNNNI